MTGGAKWALVALVAAIAGCGTSPAMRAWKADEATRVILDVDGLAGELEAVEVRVDGQPVELVPWGRTLVAALTLARVPRHEVQIALTTSGGCGIATSDAKEEHTYEDVVVVTTSDRFVLAMTARQVGEARLTSATYTTITAEGEDTRTVPLRATKAIDCPSQVLTPEEARLRQPQTPNKLSVDPTQSSPFRAGRPAPLTDPPAR